MASPSGGRAVRICNASALKVRATRVLLGTPIVLATSLAWSACGTGAILESTATGPGGETLRTPDGRPADSAQGGPVAVGGALLPNKVIQQGTAVAGCDPSVQGIGDTPLRRLTNF